MPQLLMLFSVGGLVALQPSGVAAFGASSCSETITCDAVFSTGTDASAMGFKTNASGDYSSAMGYYTTASGSASTAMGSSSTASGSYSTAMGASNNASGDFSTAMGFGASAAGYASIAMGYNTTAFGYFSTAMGQYSTASGDHSTAMGNGIEAMHNAALVNSGTISGKSLTFFADERLVAGVQAVDTAAMLRNVQSLKVVSHTPSANYCRHQNRTPADCAGDRTVGLLAQHVGTVVQGAVASASSLKLRDGNGTRHRQGAGQHPEPGHGQQPQQHQQHPHNLVLEHVESLQSLDVHVLVAQLVGAAQAQSNQIEAQSKQIEAQSKQIEAQSKQIEAQRLQAEAQSKQIAALNVKVAAIIPGNGST